MDALLIGLGFGLSFWIVLIPCLFLISGGTGRNSCNEELIEYWKKKTESCDRQIAVLISISESLKNINETMDETSDR